MPDPRRHPLPAYLPLSRVAPEPVPWLSPGRIARGKITLLDGDPGTGKSTLLCDFAARLSVGAPLPGGEATKPATVVIMSAEDDPYDTIRPRIDAAGGDPSRVVAFGALAELRPGALAHIPDHVDLLRDVVAKLEAALVVIDPLVAFLSPRLNAASDHAVRRALAALKDVAQQNFTAVVAVRHLNKGSAMANPLYRGGGSIGLLAAARAALLLAPDPADPERRILAVSKSNLGPRVPALAFRLETAPGAHAPRVVWEGESPHTAADLLRRPEPEHRLHAASALAEARAWLRAALAAGPRPAADLLRESRQAGIARNTLYSAKRAEAIRAEKEHAPAGRWIWTTTPDAP